MSLNMPKRKRPKRVNTLEMPPGFWAKFWTQLRRQDVQVRLLLIIFAAVLMWACIQPWNPPFSYRPGYAPPRDIVATVPFRHIDTIATLQAQDLSAQDVNYVFALDATRLLRLREELHNILVQLVSSDRPPAIWKEFLPSEKQEPKQNQEADAAEPTDPETLAKARAARQEEFQQFREALNKEGALAKLDRALEEALAPYERHGILKRPPTEEELGQGRPDQILIYREGGEEGPEDGEIVPVEDLLLGEGYRLQDRLSGAIDSVDVADHIYHWLMSRLNTMPSLLRFDSDATEKARQAARARVQPVKKRYAPGQTLAQANHPLTEKELQVLREEYQEKLSLPEAIPRKYLRGTAGFVLILSLFSLCGYFIYRKELRIVDSLRRITTLLLLAILTVLLSRWLSLDSWRAELIPLLFFAMTIAIAYGQEIALVLSCALAIMISYAVGPNLELSIILGGTVAAAAFMLGRVRSRGKLIKVGFLSGLVAFGLTMGLGILDGQPLLSLFYDGLHNFGWAIVTGFLVSGSLPLLERYLEVVTDISLLELGDVAHPLLQELVRRAPGTYNHSINVAALADAAAESIGANGLLVRVAAYFHDIGKMLKPSYFIENQGQDENRHDSLLPTMSTLIIIAHVKDGADLARQRHLPQPIIDIIEQHHGTTLVQYFYERANRQAEDNPDRSPLDEDAFRYPGPKPQSKEAAVLMLSDSVESASRTLAEPTPTRIRHLVEKIAMARLLDGQFDECGLNLQELKTIQERLVKSLIAVYHGRVKYPDSKPEPKPEASRSVPSSQGTDVAVG
ncbi:Metal-dependent phosphohydrolase [Planctomycetales bacterium 10988]|nr:Metal-dependent phosphohydrolase [Planctomycetales bacterium 10988]